MAFNIIEASAIALASLQETAALIPSLGSEDHLAAASDALNGAANVASQFLTDPAQQQQAVLAFNGAKVILSLFAAFKHKH